jgi:hypothetical protein
MDVTMSIRIWPSPKGSPKMVIEGGGYWPFIFCVLSALIRKVKELKSTLSLGYSAASNSAGAENATGSSNTNASVEVSDSISDVESVPTPNTANISTKVSEALSKMEASVVELGNTLKHRKRC